MNDIPGAFQDKSTNANTLILQKIWNLVYEVVWHAEDDWANIGALQARVNEL